LHKPVIVYIDYTKENRLNIEISSWVSHSQYIGEVPHTFYMVQRLMFIGYNLRD